MVPDQAGNGSEPGSKTSGLGSSGSRVGTGDTPGGPFSGSGSGSGNFGSGSFGGSLAIKDGGGGIGYGGSCGVPMLLILPLAAHLNRYRRLEEESAFHL